MSANTISALFFLCTGYAVGETVVFCAGTCLCNISHEFLFTSLLPFSFSILLLHREVGDAVPLYWLLQDKQMILSGCVCVFVWKGASSTACFLYAVFLFSSLHKLRARIWYSGTHVDSKMHTTALETHSYDRWSVKAWTQKWPLSFHTRPTFKCHSSF